MCKTYQHCDFAPAETFPPCRAYFLGTLNRSDCRFFLSAGTARFYAASNVVRPTRLRLARHWIDRTRLRHTLLFGLFWGRYLLLLPDCTGCCAEVGYTSMDTRSMSHLVE